TDLERAAGTNLARAAGTDLARATGTDLARATGTDLARATRTNLARAAGTDLARAAGTDLARATGTDLARAAGIDLARAARTDLAKVGHWKKNCHVYLAELMKNKKQVGSASSLGARKLKQVDLYLYVGNGVRAQVEAIGSFDLVLPNGLVICLDNCHYAPSITRGVVSVSRLVENGFVQCFTDFGISVSKNNVLYFNAIPSNGIYEIDMSNLVPKVNSIHNVSNKRVKHNLDSTYPWHCRLAHISKKRIEELQQDRLLESTDDESFNQCVSCLSGKMTRKSFPHCPKRATDVLGLIHTDVCGPLRHVSRQGMGLIPKEKMGYYFYFSPENKIVVERYAEFFEKNLLSQEVSGRAGDLKEIQNEDTSPSEITSEIPMEVEGFEPPQEEEAPVYRSERPHRAPDYLCLNVEVEEHSLEDLNEPANYKAATLYPESDKWLDAMNVEMQSMKDNQVWHLVYLIAIAVFYDYEIWQIDVKTAFLNDYLDEDIYMVKPEGFIDPKHPRKVCKLQRSIYGASTPGEVKRMQNVPYASAVGSIMYDERCTRPDVANTKDMFLVYGGNPKAELRVECYCDAGFETDRDDTKSQTVYIFFLNGGAVDWKSSKKSTTAMSATEAEYIAASEAGMEAVWIRKFISGLVVARYAEFFKKNLLSQEVSGRAGDLEEIQDEDTLPSEITSAISMEVEGFEPPQEEEAHVYRSERPHRAPDYLCLNVEVEEHSLEDLNEPANYKAATLDPESDKWLDAMSVEMQSMKDNQVWHLVDLIAIAVFYDYEIWQIDVKTAFLNVYLDEDIYMVQPEGFIDPKHPRKVCKLQRSIYGLNQASRSWNKKFDEEIKKMDYSKRGYIPMQERIDLNKTQGASTPGEVKRMQNVPYASANPGELHWTAVKTILKYLRNTKDMFLVYGGNTKAELRVECYCDAGFETDRDDTKSQTVYIFILNGGAVDWKSSKKSTTAMSATEAEYIAASEARMEVVLIRKFISGLGIVPTINEPIRMFCDNSAALHFANELGFRRAPDISIGNIIMFVSVLNWAK
nr:hypothetical protein [Tanacetum cinerariifolium]